MTSDLHIPDLAIGLASVMGLIAVIWQLWGQRDVLLGHLRRMMILALVFYTARSIEWTTGLAIARSLTLGAAALLPLFVLLAIEALLRRHAQGWMKRTIGVAGAGLALLALIPSLNATTIYWTVLVLFQTASFATLIWFVLTRDRASLSSAENQIVDRIGIGLLVLLPLLLSDYRLPGGPIPAAMSGVAVLITCWVLVHVGDRVFSRRRMVLELVMLLAFSALAAWLVHLHVGQTRRLEIWVMLFALTLAAAVIVGCFRLHWRSTTKSAMHKGLTSASTANAYLNDLQRGLSEQILGSELLVDFDAEALIDVFGVDGVIALSDLPKTPDQDTMGQSQMRALFIRSGTTQAYLAARQPLRIAVGIRHGMADGPDPDLLAAFGLSRLMAERDLRARS